LSVTREQMLNDLLALIPDTEPPGEGWFTLEEIAEASDKTERQLRHLYFKLWEEGKVDRWQYSDSSKVHYRVKQNDTRD